MRRRGDADHVGRLCDDTGAPFDDALDAFASSRTYELLFDFSSRQWAEGHDNLRFVWEQEKNS